MNNTDITHTPISTNHQAIFGSEMSLCRNDEMPTNFHSTIKINSTAGIIGENRPSSLADSSTLLSLIFISIAFILFNFKHCRRIFNSLTHELLNERQRANAFDERTSNENRVLASMIFILCIFEGIILYFLPSSATEFTITYNLPLLLSLIGLSIIYYLFQLSTLALVGYSFSDPTAMSQWIKGFNGSQLITLLLLAIPATIMIFYPNIIQELLITSILIYFSARIMFIFKGFRIFYHKIYSLVYFILYLCTLEIIPIIILYSGTLFLKDILQ